MTEPTTELERHESLLSKLNDDVETMERHLTDTMNRVDQWIRDVAQLARRLAAVESKLTRLDGEWQKVHPPVYSCPHCNRKVGPDDKSCGVCGKKL